MVRGYLPRIRRLMYNMTLNDAEADDLTQDAFISIYQNLHRFRNESRLSTWVYRISVNKANSFLRKRSAERKNCADCLSEIPGQPGNQPDVSLSGAETDRAVTRAIAGLPANLRTAIVLTAIEGLDYDQAARAANCLKSTLYWRVHKARNLLKRDLKDYL